MHNITHKKRLLGFTLAELMIVAAIVAILGAIAYPSYQQYTRRAQRADCQAALLNAASKQERFFGEFNTYTTTYVGGGSCVGVACGLGFPDNLSDDGNCSIDIIAGPSGDIATSYTIRATRATAVVDPCGVLTYDSRGQRGITGAVPIDDCW